MDRSGDSDQTGCPLSATLKARKNTPKRHGAFFLDSILRSRDYLMGISLRFRDIRFLGASALRPVGRRVWPLQRSVAEAAKVEKSAARGHHDDVLDCTKPKASLILF